MSIYLHGLSLRRYRGIGPSAQKAAPLKSCNFFIGANNTGKSIFLNFIALHLNQISSKVKGRLEFAPWEAHVGSHESEIEVQIGIPSSTIKGICSEKLRAIEGTDVLSGIMTSIIQHLSSDNLIWIDINTASIDKKNFSKSSTVQHAVQANDWHHLWSRLNPNTSGGTLETHWMPGVLSWIINFVSYETPTAYLIPAMRRIGAKGDSFDDYSGKGLIERLAELQNPGPGNRGLALKFQAINHFLQEVTSDSDTKIEVPFDRSELLVHKDGRVLPLSSLGTGIHEVVMIAAFCTLIEESIVCIEEPEVHLHPLLQKKLLRYLTEKTKNQYFIATHSASIIDQIGAAVFHVTHDQATTRVEYTSTPAQRLRVCQDLGYRASDLLQTNFIVWVEGPTDRIYINHWLASIDTNLQEGIHYSVMFYGGRLLSHLSADDVEIDDFIALRRLNQNMAIIIDSDKHNSRTPINDTKKRIAAEFERTGHLAWITAGREIENYLPSELLNGVLKDLYPTFEKTVGDDRYDVRLKFRQTGSKLEKIREADKVKVARAVSAQAADLGVLDLRKNVQLLYSQILAAN